MSHTILLVQPTKRPEGRTYADYESVNECMEGVCKMYEEHLKRMNPNSPSITYDISQLFDFIDDLADLSCLVPGYPKKESVPSSAAPAYSPAHTLPGEQQEERHKSTQLVQVQLCTGISYKGELKTVDGKILTTVLIPLTPSFFSEKLKNIKCSAEAVAY
ncbi:hypothetical protein TURU_165135 [Turdus rufiventris]|nr:hypothetical protein TURU_165135 [Turdus rufiventris]